MAAEDPGDLDDDLPPLVGEDGEELPPLVTESVEKAPTCAKEEPRTQAVAEVAAEKPRVAATATDREPDIDFTKETELPEGMTEEDALRATAALHAASRVVENEMEKPELADKDLIKAALFESREPNKPVSEVTERMIKAIARDDFEEVEDAIFQGADVNADCGGGMQAIHLTALRGEMFLTELLLAHKASVNARDLSGNSPLLYTCHFFKQHKNGVQMVAQLLHHNGDPYHQTKDGKMAGMTAMDIMDKECRLPQLDENAPKQMRAMIQFAMDGRDEGKEVIAKMWANFKSQNKKLYQVSSKKDNYDYSMKSVNWSTPDNAKNAEPLLPVKLDGNADSILEDKFTYLTDYSFSDEGEKVKVYIVFPESALAALGEKDALSVEFQFQSFDLILKTTSAGGFRLRLDPLFGSIEAEQCKHRISAGSKKVTLTLAKRHTNRRWLKLVDGTIFQMETAGLLLKLIIKKR
jgi:hypothetical protein